MNIQRVQQLLRDHWSSIPTLPGNPTFEGNVDDILALDYLYSEGLPLVSEGHEYEIVGLFIGHAFAKITGCIWKQDETLNLTYLSYFNGVHSFLVYPMIRFKESINRNPPHVGKIAWCLASMLIEFRQHVPLKNESDNAIEAIILKLDKGGQLESFVRFVGSLPRDQAGG